MIPKKETKNILPPLLFAGTTSGEKKYILRLKKEGKIRSLAPKLYTPLPDEEVKDVVKSSWATIVGKLFPEAVISFSTAITYLPSSEGSVFITGATNKNVKLPGLTIKMTRGLSALPDDYEYMGARVSSTARALLENFSSVKRTNLEKVCQREDIEKKLENILHAKGEGELNKLRDKARSVAKSLDMASEFKKLEQIIGALLGTRKNNSLKSKEAVARSMGLPFDPQCLIRLETLFSYLKNNPLKEIAEIRTKPDHFMNKCFFESYFSNFIEGTKFEVEVAASIVFDNQLPKARPIDAHDILGTYKLIANKNEMRLTPNSPNELETIIQSRHRVLFEKRPDIRPGEYKESINRAGNTVFVHPELVNGTFQKGFEIYESLSAGLERAIFIQFLISEVHPFNDGNGRLSRIMMNSELIKSGLTTIIIPNIYRDDYLTNLKGLSKRNDPKGYVRMLYKAHEFSDLDFSSYPDILKILTEKNWFQESSGFSIFI
jgi:fido (protein-threonine AMPylation protein)